jgi:hypothetical protein
MCGHVGLKRGAGLVKGWGQWLVGIGAVDFQHGTGVEGSSHHALMAITPSKGFFCIEANPHVNAIYVQCCIIPHTVYFSPLQVKNKPHEEVMLYAFILGPDSMVPNSDVFNPLVFYSKEPMRPPHSNPSFYLIQFQIL